MSTETRPRRRYDWYWWLDNLLPLFGVAAACAAAPGEFHGTWRTLGFGAVIGAVYAVGKQMGKAAR
jgi:hypothetical protein